MTDLFSREYEVQGISECGGLIRKKVIAWNPEEAREIAQKWWDDLGWLEKAKFRTPVDALEGR